MIGNLPRPFDMENCSVSYADTTRTLIYLDITGLGGDEARCFKTVFGDASVTFHDMQSNGVPADPWISYVHTPGQKPCVRPLYPLYDSVNYDNILYDAWSDELHWNWRQYDGEHGPCQAWWSVVTPKEVFLGYWRAPLIYRCTISCDRKPSHWAWALLFPQGSMRTVSQTV